MRIGFDATAMPDKKAGIGCYIYNIVKNLFRLGNFFPRLATQRFEQ